MVVDARGWRDGSGGGWGWLGLDIQGIIQYSTVLQNIGSLIMMQGGTVRCTLYSAEEIDVHVLLLSVLADGRLASKERKQLN